MLSRVAESLYWIGRYVERAEGTARIIDVHLQRVRVDPWTDEDRACRSLLAVMGMPGRDDPVTSADVVAVLGLDERSTASVAGALAAARENARGIPEALSAEMRECLTVTRHDLADAFFRSVRERCAVMAGLTEATMSRDEGWRFLVLGRSVERVDMTARLLRTHEKMGGIVPSWLTLLRSCGAWETFQRTYRGSLDDRHAAEFLLLDRLFPRSVFAALGAAEACLSDLEPDPGRSGVATDAQRLLGRARTNLEFRGADELIDDLAPVLADLERTCSQVDEAVSRRYFPRTAAVTWMSEVVA
ncbi:alpha-E domain-containing protein [Couchioplanes caeruleus]|uniref:alpha-E domain-containing protein n=1 Tax=Couchioplanes caeruleus TaxID=56438 RepID=UPI0020BE4944|nr:alpha-E domain-containing protein [Couchioplanes caeruleus]UQU65605.1 alpha-E domain-containing protein [Couchioplanes caeruleus]